MSRLPRSYLYVPGTDTKRMAKAVTTGTDAIILDLEDAVPAHLKDEGRQTVRRWIHDLDGPTPDVWIRVNSGGAGLMEMAALRDCPRLTGFVLAKAELPDVRRAVNALIGTGLELVPLLETAAAVLDARRIAEASVQHMQVGEYDLCADVGITPGEREDETAWARTMVVFASRTAGLLSGGERRALEIGRSLMIDPKLVLMDEPSVGLSPVLVREVFRQLVDLRDEVGITFLLIEQNARSALELSDWGYVIERGRVTYSGTGSDLLADAEVRRAFLGE